MGGGPIGVATALDLGLQGMPVVLLDDHEGVGQGSRAICFAKRTLEIAHRYGCGAPMLEKGVVWSLGKVFHRDRKVFEFNLLPEAGHRYPAFINLQQPYFEKYPGRPGAPGAGRGRADRAAGQEPRRRGGGVRRHVVLDIATPDGPYRIAADWLIGCDGANSPLRRMLGLDFEGRVFKDSFLIADIKMLADFPTERWFWFEPSHGSGASTLLHKQPDESGASTSRSAGTSTASEEMKEENIRRRLDAMLGPDVRYETRLVLDLHLPVQADGAGSATAG